MTSSPALPVMVSSPPPPPPPAPPERAKETSLPIAPPPPPPEPSPTMTWPGAAIATPAVAAATPVARVMINTARARLCTPGSRYFLSCAWRSCSSQPNGKSIRFASQDQSGVLRLRIDLRLDIVPPLRVNVHMKKNSIQLACRKTFRLRFPVGHYNRLQSIIKI